MADWRKKISIEDADCIFRHATDIIYDLSNSLGIDSVEPVLNPCEVFSAVSVALEAFIKDMLATLSADCPSGPNDS